MRAIVCQDASALRHTQTLGFKSPGGTWNIRQTAADEKWLPWKQAIAPGNVGPAYGTGWNIMTSSTSWEETVTVNLDAAGQLRSVLVLP